MWTAFFFKTKFLQKRHMLIVLLDSDLSTLSPDP